MTWTKTTPSAPGLYVYLDSGTSPLGRDEDSWYEYEKLLHVWPDHFTDILRADHGARTFAIDIGLLDGMWFGPIPEAPKAEEPKK